MDEIQAPQIVVMVRAIEVRGARDVAKRALETTGQIFRYAIAHGSAQQNPAKEIEPRGILKASAKTNYAHRREGLAWPLEGDRNLSRDACDQASDEIDGADVRTDK